MEYWLMDDTSGDDGTTPGNLDAGEGKRGR